MKTRLSSAWNYYLAWTILILASSFIAYDILTSSKLIYILLLLVIDSFFSIILLRVYVLQFDNEYIYLENIYKKVKIPLRQVDTIRYNPLLINRGFQMHYGYTLMYNNWEGVKRSVWFFIPQSEVLRLKDLKKRIIELNPTFSE